MVLFFVISMTAAYTNRNLIFEQRTGANQMRSTRALEAAEAGLQWALTQLNSGRLTANCSVSTSTADTSFRQRYLVTNDTTGTLVPRKRSDGTDLHPTCVYDGTGWTCDCPTDAAPSVAAPPGTGISPAFRIRFRRMCGNDINAADSACVTPSEAGVINIDVNACTKLDETCLSFSPPPSAVGGEGRVTMHATLALHGSIPVAPSAALTARRNVDVSTALSATNSDLNGSGVTVLAGGTVNPAVQVQGKAGTPGGDTISAGEPRLAAASMTADRMFVNTFGMWRDTFREQPAALRIDCSVSCSAATLRSKIDLNPGRVLWVIGDLDFDSTGDIGSLAQPVLLNVTGNVTFSSAVNVYGLIYSQAATWTASGGGTVTGAVVAEGNLVGTPTTDIVRDRAVLARLRAQTGSFVLVPGTWKDFD